MPFLNRGTSTDRKRESMYTLKIKWMRYEDGELADESTLFIPAEQVTTHGLITSMDQMKAWEEGSYFNYRIEPTENVGWSARLIQVNLNGKLTWYLASMAWLMSDTGKTIERLA